MEHDPEGHERQKHDTQDVSEPQAKTKARLEPRRVALHFSRDLQEEVENATLAVPVVCGSAPTQELQCGSACQFVCGWEHDC